MRIKLSFRKIPPRSRRILDSRLQRFLQISRQLSGVIPQQFGCAFHVFFRTHTGSRVLIDTVEESSHLPVVGRAANKCEHRLFEFPRKLGNTGRCFSFEGLPIQTSSPVITASASFIFISRPADFATASKPRSILAPAKLINPKPRPPAAPAPGS